VLTPTPRSLIFTTEAQRVPRTHEAPQSNPPTRLLVADVEKLLGRTGPSVPLW
jgi:hypothetical protein